MCQLSDINNLYIQWGKSSVKYDNWGFTCTLPVANSTYTCIVTPIGNSGQLDRNGGIVSKEVTKFIYYHYFSQCSGVYFLTCGF